MCGRPPHCWTFRTRQCKIPKGQASASRSHECLGREGARARAGTGHRGKQASGLVRLSYLGRRLALHFICFRYRRRQRSRAPRRPGRWMALVLRRERMVTANFKAQWW